MVVGLTGKYCSGKNAVARLFASHGFAVIDVDAIGHATLAAKAREIAEAFGPGVRAADGGINRKILGRIVFADRDARVRLEGIVHPAMAERVKETIGGMGGDVLINAAVLHRMGLHRICDAVVCVTALAPLRTLRAMRRDHLPLGEVLARGRAQKDIGAQCNDPGVDTYTVRNRGTLRSLERRVARLVRRMKE